MPFRHVTSRCSQRFRASVAFLVLLLAVSASVASAASIPASVVISGRAVPFSVTPFVGDDGEVYAPAEVVHLMGASFSVDGIQRRVTVSGANGRQVTVPFIPREGHECVSLQKITPALGASLDWQPSTTTLTLRARLEMVRQSADSLSIYTSYPVTYQVQRLDNPSRLYVDLHGLDLAAAPAAVPVSDQDGAGANVLRIRSGQIDPDTVRITIDLKRDIPFHVVSTAETDRIRVALGDAGPQGAIVAQPLPPLTVPGPSRSAAPPPATTVAKTGPVGVPVRITSVSIKPLGDSLTQIAITASGDAKYRTETLNSPNRLAFDLAGASLDAAVNQTLPGSGPLIKAVRSGILRTGLVQFGRVVVDLNRLAAYSVTRQVAGDGSVTYLINVQAPHEQPVPPEPSPFAAGAFPSNSLRGKIVVVDPGHGGRDSGSLAPNGSMEKTFTLAIGLKLRDLLIQNGATVYMTREDDVLPSVMARPQFAINHGADYFISVHCDSAGGQNTHSGSTAYFHAQNGVCRLLATDIINRVAEVSGIPANGVKSDTIRFQTGFGVLRGSTMPAVLIECGYMNNDEDLAKLRDDETQQHIAEGIVAGLRDFVADRSAR